MKPLNLLLGAILSFAIGAASDLFGIGGGPLMVPLLIYVLELDGKVARGTSLALVIITGITGLLRRKYFLKQSLAEFFDWRTFLFTAPFTVLGSLLIGTILQLVLGYQFELSPGSEDLLRRSFAIILLIIGVKMLLWP